MKKKISADGTVSMTRERGAPLTKAEREQIAALVAMGDKDINTSDIPVMSDEDYARAQKFVGRFYKPVKANVTLRVDADVLDWFKQGGSGYQTRMNEVLRREMLSNAIDRDARRQRVVEGTKPSEQKRKRA